MCFLVDEEMRIYSIINFKLYMAILSTIGR